MKYVLSLFVYKHMGYFQSCLQRISEAAFLFVSDKKLQVVYFKSTWKGAKFQTH